MIPTPVINFPRYENGKPILLVHTHTIQHRKRKPFQSNSVSVSGTVTEYSKIFGNPRWYHKYLGCMGTLTL